MEASYSYECRLVEIRWGLLAYPMFVAYEGYSSKTQMELTRSLQHFRFRRYRLHYSTSILVVLQE